jgi:hypothetical protein
VNKNFLVFMGVLALSAILAAVTFRYETVPVNVNYYYQTDRWTGRTYLCGTQFDNRNNIVEGCRER